ncbi:sensor histidine kinase [Paenibacillus lutrae]|uniref:histidine kinase n=1 Tax=Paenibacillus lutrae TaxID=2078573 RepID=A0A7X3JYK5_9BACL|nr:HAMP domain-containing sensor histidine kinase [Paenibacillus lutrae]MVO99062.1 sensor histidine kinase [Paenibacillus lutrae]
MKLDKTLSLQLLQLLVISALILAELAGPPPGWLRWACLLTLFLLSWLYLYEQLRTRARLHQIQQELRRVLDGNRTTRLLAKDSPSMNEVIFTINELIHELEQVQIEAVQSQAARKSLLSSISHDIRTPLTSIIGYVDALKDGAAVTQQEQRDYLDILSRKAGALKHLTDEMFNMAKLDADEFPIAAEPLDLAEAARESLIEFLPELKQAGMELIIRIPEEKRFMIAADRLSLNRILGNLIKNAIHYGKEGGVLGIELTEIKGGDYQLSLWDQGPGIAPGDIGHVFQRMYRSDAARSPSSGGSGLGLSIARALTEKNGGRIGVSSVPWSRTAFTLIFPQLARPALLRNN